MLVAIQDLLVGWGLTEGFALLVARATVIVLVLTVALGAYIVARKVVLRGARHLASRSRTRWDDLLMESKVFDRLTHIAPALVLHGGASLAFPDSLRAETFTQNLCLSWMILITALVISALLNGLLGISRTIPAMRDIPLKSFVQVAKLLLSIATVILILGTLMEKNPAALLTGLGAMTALVMLIFKDSILGFVGSLQLSLHDMVRVGDWIEMPRFGADGDVIDISLTTVKVQNWDKTISTVPTYALITNSFRNWRGMSESGGRRIKRSILIDQTTVGFCDQEMIDRFRRFDRIRDYIDERVREVEEHNREQGVDMSVAANGRRLTNLGTFRRYLEAYLRTHPSIHPDMTLLVRQLEPTDHGIPIQIYAFSSDQAWASYEAIQADVFDHILAVIPEFGLRVFQTPTGEDVERLAKGLAAPAPSSAAPSSPDA